MSAPSAASDLQFRLLGPLEVVRAGRPLKLGGERQRALLALLLIHANEVVSSDRLIEALFGEQSPETAGNAVQVGISRLRRMLEDGILVTRPPGYVLRADPDQLDVALFEHLLQEGRHALEADDPAAAQARLREALALWRGPPLADVALLDFAQPEIRRLEELRLSALMERIDADLALGLGGELVAELEALAAANPLQERLRGQLMLALYRSGRQADALAVYRATRELLTEELGLEPSRALQQLERSILQQDAALDRAPRVEPQPEDVVLCPFKGLASFEVDDAEYFFGRERVVSDVVSRLVGSSFVGLVGPSGSGKSSILKAGLLPALAAGVLPGSERWTLLSLRPGEHPLAELEHVLARGGGERLVLAVDQLEEVFTACQDEAERESFLGALAETALGPDRRTIVVVTLRADFYGRCAEYPRLAELLSGSHLLVGPMARDELARAIELPASRAGLQVERPLVDALVGDVVGEPGALPLLSTSLLELWGLRDGRVLRHAVYRAAGGVRGAVARLAEQAYAQLGGSEREAARRMLLRLTTEDEGAVVRRRVPLSELDVELDAEAARALAVLTDARLVTVSGGAVELSHEALVREWPRLRDWLDEDRDGQRLHAHLASSARDWAARGRDQADLYRGRRLVGVEDWSTTHERDLNELEREFVEASRENNRLELSRQRRQNRRLRMLLGGVAGLLVLAVVAGIVALLQRRSAQSEARTALARQLGAEAIVEPRIDRAMLLAREAVQLDRSTETAGTLLSTLLRSPAALATFTLPIDARPLKLTASPDGQALVVGDNHGQLRFYDTRTRRQTRPPFAGANGYLPTSYSRDGSLLLTAAAGFPPPGLQLLDARTLRQLGFLRLDHGFLHPRIDTGAVTPLGLSPDGKTAFFAYDLVVSSDGTEGPAFLDRWDVASGKLTTVPLGSPDVVGAGFVRGGAGIVTVTSGAIETWDARTLRRLRLIRSPVQVGGYAAVSPDGRRVAALGRGTGAPVFIDTTTRRAAPAQSGGHEGGVLSFQFSPDGSTVATTGDDGKVILWDPVTGVPRETLVGHGGRAISAAFTADGRTLYSASLDGAIFEWDVKGDRRYGRSLRTGPPVPALPNVPQTPPLAVSPEGSQLAVRVGRSRIGLYGIGSGVRLRLFRVSTGSVITALAWSPSGGTLAVAGSDGRVQLWSVTGRPRRVRSNRLPEPVQSIAFSRDGRLVAAVDLHRLALWSVDSGRRVWRPVSLGSAGVAVAFSPDGTLIAAALQDGRVRLFDSRTARAQHTLRPDGQPLSAAFAPDGRLATGTWAGIVQLWEPATGRQLGHPTLVAAAPVAGISFAPDGRTFATAGGSDGLAKLWTTATLQQFGSSFPVDPGRWGNVAVTPDGRRLVVAYDDGRVDVWPISLPALEQHACTVAGRSFTREEWARLVPGRSYRTVCPTASR